MITRAPYFPSWARELRNGSSLKVRNVKVKQCAPPPRGCGLTRSIALFNHDKVREDGRCAVCRDCTKRINKANRKRRVGIMFYTMRSVRPIHSALVQLGHSNLTVEWVTQQANNILAGEEPQGGPGMMIRSMLIEAGVMKR